MELTNFVEKFTELFDETDASEFTAGTKFRDLEEWSSLLALSVMAMADEEYGVKLKGDDIRNSQTIEDIFNAVKSKA